MRLEFTGLNTNKFHDEIIAEGINPIVTSLDSTTWLDFPDIVEEVDTGELDEEGTPVYEPVTSYKKVIENQYEYFDWPALEAQIQALAAQHDPAPMPPTESPEDKIARLEAVIAQQEEAMLQKLIDILPARVLAESIEEQYQEALAELGI